MVRAHQERGLTGQILNIEFIAALDILPDPDRSVQTIHHVGVGVSMVPVGSILGCGPAVCPTMSGLNWLLVETRNSIRPRGILLFNAMEMNRGTEW